MRKKNVGLVSIAIASLAIYGLAIGAPTVQADENSSVNAVSTENVTAPASTDTTAAAGLASEVSTPSTSFQQLKCQYQKELQQALKIIVPQHLRQCQRMPLQLQEQQQ
ncbi:hypothetical protein [Streptococcus anginosus]|uniref:hypothetical protein n=1 Tax=Streptococcus anginosus TaxID=1328 RepID=UPI00386CD193